MAKYAYHRLDAPHIAVRTALRAAGAKVFDLKGCGGLPDLLVVHRGKAWPLEVKTKTGKLTADQMRVFAEFAAAGLPVVIVRSVEDALAVIGVRR